MTLSTKYGPRTYGYGVCVWALRTLWPEQSNIVASISYGARTTDHGATDTECVSGPLFKHCHKTERLASTHEGTKGTQKHIEVTLRIATSERSVAGRSTKIGSPQRRTAVMAQTRSTSNTKISGSISSFSHETSSSVTHRTKHSVNSNLSNSSTAHCVKSSSLDTHRTVYIVFLSLLLDLLAFTMILPLLPSLLDHYRLNDSPQGLYPWLLDKVRHFQHLVGAPDRFNSVLFGGFLGSMFSFLQFVASPLVGGLSDVYGRKPVLLTCLVGIASSYVLWAFSSSFALFVLARVVGGISKGNVSLSMAIITDISTPAARGRGMALVGIAFSVGFIIGPVIGAMFAHWSHNQTGDWFVVPALFALGLGLADILFVMLCFKESLPKTPATLCLKTGPTSRSLTSFIVALVPSWKKYFKRHERRAKSVAGSLGQAAAYINVMDLFRFRAMRNISQKDLVELRRLGFIYFVYLFLYSGLEFTLTFLTHHTFNYTSMQQGWMFFAIGVTMALMQGGYIRRLPEHKIRPTAVLNYISEIRPPLGGSVGGAYITLTPQWVTGNAGLFLIVPSYVCVGLASSYILLYVGLFLYAVCKPSGDRRGKIALGATATPFSEIGVEELAHRWLPCQTTAMVVSCLTTLVSKHGSHDQKGTVMGIFRSLGALARATGPIFASIDDTGKYQDIFYSNRAFICVVDLDQDVGGNYQFFTLSVIQLQFEGVTAKQTHCVDYNM
uniref:Major facilitator superfamily (MFS) profile domain-containing protein n=1 Tax=Timema shepardi TaxID=629360 RepID=A0A7R9G026_TIMSH|nr:unnamed protein product [Timema shepardi]